MNNYSKETEMDLRDLLAEECSKFRAMEEDDPKRKDTIDNIVKINNELVKYDSGRTDRGFKIFTIVKDVGLGAAGLALYKKLFREGLQFEETGAFRSGTVNNLFKNLKFPFMK